MLELRDEDLVTVVTIKRKDGKILMNLELRRNGKMGLKIHERISSLEELRRILERPKWLGEKPDELVRRAIRSILEGKHEEAGGV